MNAYRHQNRIASLRVGLLRVASSATSFTVVLAVSSFAMLVIGCGKGTSALPSSGTQTSPQSPAAAPNIVVVPATGSVQAGGTDQLSMSQGSPQLGGQWVVDGGAANGTIDSNGLYQAPSIVPSSNKITAGYLLPGGQEFSTSITLTNAIPVLSSITPATLTTLSTQIQVVGSGFVSGSQVLLDGIPVTTSFQDSAHLSATVLLSAPISQNHQVTIQDPDSNLSSALTLPASFTTFRVQPSLLNPGPITVTVSGSGFSPSDAVTLNGTALATTFVSASQLSATGYLPPWIAGNALIGITSGASLVSNGSPSAGAITEQAVPIAPTAVSYDAASRFATQAAFGPRPGLVEHIQQVGFDAFITEQFKQAPVAFSSDPRREYFTAASSGNSLLRQRVAYALGTFLVQQWRDFDPSSTYYETALETDASANFRQLLSDVVASPNIGYFLNLANNNASANPNQNFGRELMQLFTIGPVLLNDDGSQQLDGSGNPIPSYDQDTVVAVTKAFTGWGYPAIVNAQATGFGIDWSQPLAPYEWAHDHGAKTLFGITLSANNSITDDRDQVLGILFNHPNLPPFISLRLIQQLVTSNPSPAYIGRISAVFKDNGQGVRGDMATVVRAVLLDPEARLGDTTPSPNDGFLQDAIMFQLSAVNALQTFSTDDQCDIASVHLGESLWYAPTVFGFVTPANVVPGTSIKSPDFGQFSNISLTDRSQMLWGLVSHTYPGYTANYEPNSWLFNNFTTVPAMVDALNHLVYHGTMSEEQKNIIISASQQSSDPTISLETAVFLALNADSASVSH